MADRALSTSSSWNRTFPILASIPAALILTISVVLLSVPRAIAGPVLSAATLQTGATCYYDKSFMPAKPTCVEPFNCVVKEVLPKSNPMAFRGQCEKSVPDSSVCRFQSVPYAVGTTGIAMHFACDNCTCTQQTGGAACVCAPGKPCRVNVLGQSPKGRLTCSGRQSQCLVDRIQGRMYAGNCISPAMATGQCVTAGEHFGPVFAASGFKAAVLGLNRPCDRCSCENGVLTHCRTLRNCKLCKPTAGAGAVDAQCKSCCASRRGFEYQACIDLCGAYAKP
eukprot:TRINITY_DN21166_c0_g1_i1.p1 TRINITY_DN21166_c0_g1~~TRINITY_DN21166_c0_g1_i1.p1  ORF type:complete len:280 (-),score=-19.25 TRINITY_DN21166_c0_g1_i1:128-967(-)